MDDVPTQAVPGMIVMGALANTLASVDHRPVSELNTATLVQDLSDRVHHGIQDAEVPEETANAVRIFLANFLDLLWSNHQKMSVPQPESLRENDVS